MKSTPAGETMFWVNFEWDESQGIMAPSSSGNTNVADKINAKIGGQFGWLLKLINYHWACYAIRGCLLPALKARLGSDLLLAAAPRRGRKPNTPMQQVMFITEWACLSGIHQIPLVRCWSVGTEKGKKWWL